MSEAPFYSRRLTSKELDLWIQLGKEDGFKSSYDSDDKETARAFLNLENSMFFISYLGDDAIGGSSIFKDSTRNAMALLSIRIHSDYREQVTSHIVKSSLPFFRTVAIREVDAILSEKGDESHLPFPLQNELPFWTSKALDENGFTKSAEISQITFNVPESKMKHDIMWDNSPAPYENVRKLFWSIDEDSRPDYSHLWLEMNLGRATNNLFTSSKNDECEVSFALQTFQDRALMQSLLYQQNTNISDISRAVIESCQKKKLDSLTLNAIADKYSGMVDEFVSLCGEPVQRRKLALMRKFL
ncbi:MAG: hypothetical protein KAR33_12970 [Candidatus Thorarchaeota archaeon]|nr:hypothetical protein [Candidatus Thorarchaeota archaeon]